VWLGVELACVRVGSESCLGMGGFFIVYCNLCVGLLCGRMFVVMGLVLGMVCWLSDVFGGLGRRA